MNGSVQSPIKRCESQHHQSSHSVTISRNELFWIEVIRQASDDTDPPPQLDVVRRVRSIFREFRGTRQRVR